MNKYYEQIRAACIKNDPSILDLVMGCEVKWKDWQWIYCWLAYIDWLDMWHIIDTGDKFLTAVFSCPEPIGRQITLQDVLRLTQNVLWIEIWGNNILAFTKWDPVGGTCTQFHLDKSVENQPIETLKFICENIKYAW